MANLNFFTCNRRPYYIVSSDFVNKFAGVRALHYLCHMLNQLGAEAYLLGCQKTNPKLRTPLLQTEDLVRHQQLGLAPIVVYPETITGNPLAAQQIVRWLLNKPGHLGSQHEFNDAEMLFAFSADFTPEGMTLPLLRVPVVDTSIFHNRQNEQDDQREGVCYYANKYLAKGGRLTHHVEGAQSLCQDVSLSQQQLAAILRKSELLICYEPSSIVAEALLCGCPVAIIPTDYLDGPLQDFDGPGIALGTETEAIKQAKKSVHKATEDYQRLERECIEHVKQFIHLSRARFSVEMTFSTSHAGKILDFIKPPLPTTAPYELELAQRQSAWLAQHALDEARVTVMAERLSTQWQWQPGFHLLVVLNAHELEYLAATLTSLQEQLYSAWGLTILSDVPAPDIFNDVPENIEWIQIQSSINEEIDKAVEAAGLDWIMQILPGDTLPPHALLSFGETLQLESGKHLIYCDELEGGPTGKLCLKPDFSLDYLRAWSYLGRGVMVSREAFVAVGGYTRFAYVDVTDMAFKVYEHFGEMAFSHIPDLLYISAIQEREAATLSENEWLIRHAHFNRCQLPVTISHPENKNRFQTHYKHNSHPLVSIVIAHCNQATHLANCIDEIVASTVYPNYEIVVVDVDSEIEDLANLYVEFEQQLGERFRVRYSKATDYAAAINGGVEMSRGEYLVILSCFARTVNGNWLAEMLNLAQRDDVAIVGARIIRDDNKIVHAGGMLGGSDDVTGLYLGRDISEPGYMERAHCIQEYAAVSSACVMVSASAYKYVGGLAAGELADSKYLFMDFCLRLKAEQGRVLWTPYATIHLELLQASQGNGIRHYLAGGEMAILKGWGQALTNDPFYNWNLSLENRQCLPETEIICGWDQRIKDKWRVMALPLNSSGAGQYRLKAPLRALEQAGLIQLTLLPDHELQQQPRLPSLFELNRLKPDVIYVQQALSDIHYAFLLEVKKYTDIKIIFSLDDLVTDLPPMSDRRRQVFRDMRHRLRRTLALCERVIVSTEPLAKLCSQYCDDVVVIPNRLESSRWLALDAVVTQRGQKPRVGWAGALQHGGDLAVMTEVVKTLADRVDWVFMGMCPPELRAFVTEFHEFVRFDLYPQKLADLNLDLALAPLEKHPFNEAKSNLRLLEYGILGWPVIASDIFPYRQHNAPVTLVANEEQAWTDAIVAALQKPEKIAAQGRQLADWTRQNFILEEHLDDWLSALKTS